MANGTNANEVFLLLMIAHALGDFYLQSDSMAQRKSAFVPEALRRHGIVYGACMMAVMLCCAIGGWPLFLLALSGSVAHYGIDACKKQAVKIDWVKRHIFTLDQCVHIGALFLLWQAFGKELTPQPVFNATVGALSVRALPLLLAVLLVLKPVGCLIGSGEIWDLGIAQGEGKMITQDGASLIGNRDNKAHSGRVIGYLERLIIMFLLMNNQYSAIAFVLTAKSVARFKALEEQMNAEYYLIGTLLSVVSVFAVVLLLGLRGS